MKSLFEIRKSPPAAARPLHHAMARGGRLRRTGRGVVPCAPWLGMTAAAATGAGMLLGAGEPALAQGCMEQTTGGTRVCRGTATATRTLSADANETLVVTDDAGFSITTTSGPAFTPTTDAESTGLTAALDNAVMSSGAVSAPRGSKQRATAAAP